MAEGIVHFEVVMEEQQAGGDDGGVDQEQADKKAKLRITKVGEQGAAAPHCKMQGKVEPANQNEQGGGPVDQWVVPVGHGGIVGGKAAGGHGAEAVTNGVEHAHAESPVQQGTGNGNKQVDKPQGFGRFGDAWGEFGVFHGAGDFSFVELHATDAEHGQNGHGQYYYTHATQPL